MAGSFTAVLMNKNDPLVQDTSNFSIEKHLTYADIYNKLKAAKESVDLGGRDDVGAEAPTNNEGTPTDQIGDDKDSWNTGNDTPDYSDTNIQVEGVQEADIVKTDGNYIYAVFNSSVYIYKAEDGKLTKVSVIKGEYDQLYPDMKPTESTESIVYDDGVTSEVYVDSSIGETKPSTGLADTSAAYAEPDESRIDESGVETNSVEYYYYNNIIEMYVYKDILVIIQNPQINGLYNNSAVGALIYNIEDRANPELVDTIVVDGNYSTTRMIDNQLYILSTKYADYSVSEDSLRSYIPYTYAEGETKPILPDNIIMPADISTSIYSIVSAIDVSGDVTLTSQKAVLGCSSSAYVSLENMYFSSYSMYDYRTVMFENQPDESTINTMESNIGTIIIKLSLNDGNIEFEASGMIKGYIQNQFSMDEYNGYFRVATTSYDYTLYPSGQSIDIYDQDMQVTGSRAIYYWGNTGNSQNNVYVLKQEDDKLTVTGKIENLAEGERIYSARFDGDIGYIVTYRQVDPLFAVDLSNPASPELLSELKIPGYSTYMHVYDENLLFGFGVAADENGMQTGLKLSMFDVADKLNVNEEATLVLPGYSYSEALYNHKAILVNPAKKLIGFASYTYEYDNYEYKGFTNSYNLFTYDDQEGFVKLAEFNFSDSMNFYGYNVRGLFIGDYFYVVSSNTISSFSLTTYQSVDNVTFTD
ncbi:MAG TPA: hypothetical protein DDZ99_04105 [Clostridiales bacterium]|nr:hypothetical protein [Clostridiales bacterium]